MGDEILREVAVPRLSTSMPSTPQAFNMRPSNSGPLRTAPVLTSMTNRPFASSSGSRPPFTGSAKDVPLTSKNSSSGSKNRKLREEVSSSKTSSARYHQHANGTKKTPVKKSTSSAPSGAPNMISFSKMLGNWVLWYYGKNTGNWNAIEKEHIVKIWKMEHFGAVTDYVTDLDYELKMYGWKLKKEAKYDKTIALYKALRNLYYYFTNEEFKSKIDRDGDWIMGYLIATYIPI